MALLVTLPAASLLAQPAISKGGIVNSASYTVGGLPNSGIAQGAIVLIFGSGLGPASLVQAPAGTSPTDLAGVSVRAGSNAAPLTYVSSGQIAAILPSATPVGAANLTVTYNGQSSAPEPITVVANNFGIYTRSNAGAGPAWVQHYDVPAGSPLLDYFNSLVHPAKPGGVYTIYGTGLGPVADDRNPRPGDLPGEVSVVVGGKTAAISYRGRISPGLDQINFQLPSDVPEGCYVPLYVRAGGLVSNFASMSIATNSNRCSVSGGLSANDLAKAAAGQTLSLGVVTLGRSRIHVTAPIIGTIEGKADTVSGYFYALDPSTLFAARGLNAGFGLSPFGTCTVVPFRSLGRLDEVISPLGVDAGAALNVKGPVGAARALQVAPGTYAATVGGTLPAILPGGGNSLPDYLEPGSYNIDNGTGGTKVGAFATTMQISAPVVWTNRDALNTVPRTQPLTVTWSGGAANQFVVLSGFSPTPAGPGAGFNCVEQAAKGSFTVPAEILSALPVSATIFGAAQGTLTVTATLAVQDSDKPKAQGVDALIVNYSDSNTRTLGYQ